MGGWFEWTQGGTEEGLWRRTRSFALETPVINPIRRGHHVDGCILARSPRGWMNWRGHHVNRCMARSPRGWVHGAVTTWMGE